MDPKRATGICGIIGGMSHFSSDKYKPRIHEQINKARGGYSCADIMTRDVNFQRIRDHMVADRWDELGKEMAEIAAWMVEGGADRVAIATNTVHKVAPQVIERIGEEHFLHIGDCIARQCYECGAKVVLLLGTAATMSGDFIRGRLEQNGLTVITPDYETQGMIDDIIFKELVVNGEASDLAISLYTTALKNRLSSDPVDAIILGCTELSMLVRPFDLCHSSEMLKHNGKPFEAIDSTEAQITALAQVCLGRWKPTLPQ